jgi:putative membrane-bound dehydrogenase-like protein
MLVRRAVCAALVWCAFVPTGLADEFPAPPNTEKATTSPMAPEQVVATARLPEGFKLSVFAAEPDVQNPIAITTDERGRIWGVENYTWAGANLGVWDTTLKDRVVVLEDVDGDGAHDKRTVFWDQGRKATSVEVGFGGVWVLTLPHLLFIPDRNRDDVPDGPPQVVLDGIDEQSVGHTPANGLKWGPDGWLYARHGIQGTSSIGPPQAADSQRVKINTGVWRYHPVRGTVEAVMHGMTNSWGFDYDQHGEMFVINTVIGHLWHLVPGAHVERMYGADINPRSYGLIAQTADHVHWDTGEKWNDVRAGVSDRTSAAGGGHAHIGLLIYQGDNWPAEYRGRVLTLNLHGQRINRDVLARHGAGYTATHGADFCFLADPWYRGMDLVTGPDGGVYISDWSDTGECHDHDGVHRNSGRIYKLTYGEPRRVEPFDVATFDHAKLIDLQQSENDWWARMARRIVQERAATASEADVAALRRAIQTQLDSERDPVRRLRLLWTAHAAGVTPDLEASGDGPTADEHERVWRLRLTMDRFSAEGPSVPQEVVAQLVSMARNDASGLVQLYLASALQRLPVAQRFELAEALCQRSEFAGDRMLPLMVWYGIEPAVSRERKRAVKLARDSRIPLVRQYIARRLTEDIESRPRSVDELVELAASETAQAQDILTGMAEALRGWSRAPQPQSWSSAAAKLALSEALKKHLQELGLVFGDGRAAEELRAIVFDASADASARRQALRVLLAGKPADLVGPLQGLAADRAVAQEAIRGLALYDHPETPARLRQFWNLYGPGERSEAINTLASRPAYARALFEMLRAGQIAKSDISAQHARQIDAFEVPELSRQLSELWGEVRATSAERSALVDKLKSQLKPEVLAAAELPHGRVLFQKNCANCHVLYGVGRKVGPDLTGSNRKNLDYLLENIVDPSASVGADFRAWTVALDDGRVLSGVLTAQSDRTLTLDLAQEQVTLDRATIEEMRQTPNSLMPDGLLQPLTDGDIRDLVAYLMSLEQVELPGAADEESKPQAANEADRARQMVPTRIAGTFQGGELVELRVRGRMAYIVKPTGAVDPQKRWLWEFPFWLGINDGFGNLQHRGYVERALAAGFHVAGVEVGPSCASPAAAEVCQAFYEQLVREYGLHPRARILGQSHGGLIAYGWAFRNPSCVERIGGICPATDFRSWPTLANVVNFPTKGLDYGLPLEELDRRSAEFNPIDNLAPLATAGVKILHIHGDRDELVPMDANSTELARRYRRLGGDASIVVLSGLGHGGQVLYESQPLVEFLLGD